jgi:amidase
MNATADLPYSSLLDVGARIRAQDLSPVSVVEEMLERIATVDVRLHSYLSVEGEAALETAEKAEGEINTGRYRGPLHGVPIAIKDLFHTAGTPSTFGSVAYRDFVSNYDATLVKRLKTAGAIILGRLHLHEGAYAEHHPDLERPVNPWHADYWPGGSSSGSGVATAAGLCFASLGTDTGGSIRFPSAANGVTGLKPTWGRTSRYGVFPLADSLDTIGPMARSAADAAAMFDAMAGYDPNDPTSLTAPVPDYLDTLDGVFGARDLRIGIDESYLEDGTDPEVAAAIRLAIEVFAVLGAELVPVKVPSRGAVIDAQLVITEAECAVFHAPAFEVRRSDFGPALAGAIERGLKYDASTMARAYIARDRFKGELAKMFQGIDALISPVYPKIGFTYEAFGEFLDDLPGSLGFTSPFNVSGSPSVTLPCGMAKAGLPIGMQLIGPHLSEASLLAAAHAFQQATDWHLKRPPLA